MTTGSQSGSSGGGVQPATPRQLKFIQAMAREHGISDDQLEVNCKQIYGCSVAELNRRDASAFIERLQAVRMAHEPTEEELSR